MVDDELLHLSLARFQLEAEFFHRCENSRASAWIGCRRGR